ncbi:hypothetical protein LJC40_02315 [Synergistaceae bacterium OttesenSCG-928-D05]|nr:hypothetical protein [Synergistaceae bacterium OttesenSCG-928-D05]
MDKREKRTKIKREKRTRIGLNFWATQSEIEMAKDYNKYFSHKESCHNIMHTIEIKRDMDNCARGKVFRFHHNAKLRRLAPDKATVKKLKQIKMRRWQRSHYSRIMEDE